MYLYLIEVKSVEERRDAIVMENEEQVTIYYRIRQQLQRLEKEMQVGRTTVHVYMMGSPYRLYS